MAETEQVIALISIGFVLMTLAGMVVLMRRIAGGQAQESLTPELIEELTVDRYRPMARLLSTEDFQFMRSQCGYTSRMERRIRQQRMELFGSYLRSLESDFGNLCNALQTVVIESSQDRPDLVAAMLKSKFQFIYGVSKVRFQLVLYRYAWTSVDVTAVLSVFDSMRVDLRSMVPAQMGAAA